MSENPTPLTRPIRAASREMIRELGILQMPGTSMPRCHALIELAHHGCLTVLGLAELLRLDKSTASRVISNLEKEGLVSRRPNQADRRQKPLMLTELGREAVAGIQKSADVSVNLALATLAPENQARVLEGLSLYAKALRRAREKAAYSIRPIAKKDNETIARIIRETLIEYGADKPGTAFTDPEVDEMFETYQGEDRGYYVIEHEHRVMGGGGYAPLRGAPGVCELQKMYFSAETRGFGLGADILGKCLSHALDQGYHGCYLETLTHMERAQRLYRQFGFTPLDQAMGHTGHCGCNTYYYKELKAP